MWYNGDYENKNQKNKTVEDNYTKPKNFYERKMEFAFYENSYLFI